MINSFDVALVFSATVFLLFTILLCAVSILFYILALLSTYERQLDMADKARLFYNLGTSCLALSIILAAVSFASIPVKDFDKWVTPICLQVNKAPDIIKQVTALDWMVWGGCLAIGLLAFVFFRMSSSLSGISGPFLVIGVSGLVIGYWFMPLLTKVYCIP